MSKDKESLIEIKRGQFGTGLLIENDGYISLNETEGNRKLMESFITEDVDGRKVRHVPRPFIVDAVFQKYDVKNANGRIYPEAVLKKQVELYQTLIREHRALGECYTPDVLILTENEGWKKLGDVKEGESILTLNTENGTIECKPIKQKISYTYNGEMVRIQGNHINDLVTPNHKFPVMNRNGSFKGFYTADDFFNGDVPDMSHSFITKRGVWNRESQEYFTIPSYENPSKRTLRLHEDCEEPLLLKTSSFMKFIGIYLSEGDVSKNGFDVRVYQVKESVCELINELFTELGLPYIRYYDGRRTTFTIREPRLHQYLKKLGDCYSKYIPSEIKNQSKENLRYLYDWFVLGDGRSRYTKDGDNKRSVTDDVFSTSKQLILDLNEIQLKIGYNGTYHVEKRDNDRYIEGRLIEGKNTKPLHFTYRSLSSNVFLDKRYLSVTKESYNGEVCCVEVENHTWFVMSNGKTHWTGNCNHPSESTIDLSRISHNIIELHWEGRTLVGKLELNITDGFANHGIVSSCGDTVANLLLNGYKVGVSSRGVGSVENKMGQSVVGNDFELICWDIVSTPSTPGAWIAQTEDGNDLNQYMEAKSSAPVVDERISKMKELLS